MIHFASWVLFVRQNSSLMWCFFGSRVSNIFCTNFLGWFPMWNSAFQKGHSRLQRGRQGNLSLCLKDSSDTNWLCCFLPPASRHPEPPVRVMERQGSDPWPAPHACEHSWKCLQRNHHLGLSPEVCRGGWVVCKSLESFLISRVCYI